MTDESNPWKIPTTQQEIDEYNRKARLAMFPPDQRWAKVEGLYFQPLSTPQQGIVSVGGIDHKGEVVKFWTDVPNAMHLLRMLADMQAESKLKLPSGPPDDCKPFDGNVA